MVKKRKTEEKIEVKVGAEEKKPKEKMVVIYDPSVNAFREVPLSLAIKFIESARNLEEKLVEEGEIEIEEE